MREFQKTVVLGTVHILRKVFLLRLDSWTAENPVFKNPVFKNITVQPHYEKSNNFFQTSLYI